MTLVRVRPLHLASRLVVATAVVATAVLLTGACMPALRVAPPTAAEIPSLEAHLAGSPADVDRMVRLGVAYREAGRADDAARILEDAVRAQPAHPAGVFYLGLTYEDQERFAEARDLYRRYLEVGTSAELKRLVRARLPLLQRRELQAAVKQSLAREAELANTPPQPRTVAVFPFRYTGQDSTLRPIGRALAEMLTTDLAQTDRLSVLERLRVQTLLDEVQLGAGGLVDTATAVRGGHLLGAGRIVQGNVDVTDRALALQAAVIDVRSPAAPQADAAALLQRGEVSQLLEMEKQLALRTYEALGISLTPAERERVTRKATENVQALLAYGLGLEASDRGDFEAAVRHFGEAAALDPGFAAARERAETAAASAVASRTSTAQLAEQGAAEMAASGLDATLARLVPAQARRDPASEALGLEGVGAARTVVEVIIQRP